MSKRVSHSRSPLRVAGAWSAGVLVFTAISAASGARLPAPAPTGTALYERDILPLLRGRCLGCHGAPRPNAGLDIRKVGDLLEGGYSGPAVVPGSPEKSLLYQMLADGRMPRGGGRLDAAELAKVARWIRGGAKGLDPSGHWAFQPPVAPRPPRVRHAERVVNPIDRFLLADLERAGLSYSPEADRHTLLRRVTFDLIGLPPTPEEIAAFDRECDAELSASASRENAATPNRGKAVAPKAYERLIDRLLADPRYGERWARHWLDTAGYADSEGVLQEDRIRPNAWRYRDYVIRSFNADKPYDQFLREQLAGDELSDYRRVKQFTPEVIEKLDATGFLRTAVDATRDDFNPHQYGEYQYRMLHDTQTIVVSTTMGLTIQCARCHDHKYEPLSQKDYYRIQALFTPAVRPRGKLLPTSRRQIIAATAEEQAHAKKVNAAVDAAKAALTREQAAALRDAILRHLPTAGAALPKPDRAALLAAAKVEDAKRSPEQKALVAKHKALLDQATAAAKQDADYRKQEADIQARLAAEEKKRIHLTEIRAFYDQDAEPPPTPLLIRGDWLRPGEPVAPGVPEILNDPAAAFTLPEVPKGADTTKRRTAFAEWLTRPDHPLTARVIVNRLWAQHFGVGIVPSVENFGRSGTPPTNQALLDWLAASFVKPVSESDSDSGMGSSLKRLHRLMVTSAAYRQSSTWREEAGAKDPENRLLWRQRPRRLEAEAVRDAVLHASGQLDPTMYGPCAPITIRPTGEVVVVGEEGKGRRSIYVLVRRTQPVHLLDAFDAPVMETNCTRRTQSTTATQALALMNSTFISAQARHFAARVLASPDRGDGARIDLAYRLALSREPSPTERARMLDFLRSQRLLYLQSGGAEAEQRAWSDLCHTLLGLNEFVYVD